MFKAQNKSLYVLSKHHTSQHVESNSISCLVAVVAVVAVVVSGGNGGGGSCSIPNQHKILHL